MLEKVLYDLSQKNKDKRIWYCDIQDERVHTAVRELLEMWETPVACWYEKDISRYKALWVETITAPEHEENIPLFLGRQLFAGKIDGMIWWAVTSTRNILLAWLKSVRKAKNVKKISSHMILANDTDFMLFADCVVRPMPSSQDLAETWYLAVKSAIWYGLTPRVSMLSFSTLGSWWEHPEVQKVKEATRLLQERLEDEGLWDIEIAWEVQFDAAFIPSIGKLKDPNFPLTKPANIYIFPDLDSGNIWYKIAERVGRMRAIWAIIQWLSKPVNDVSRGCSIEDLKATHHITKNQYID